MSKTYLEYSNPAQETYAQAVRRCLDFKLIWHGILPRGDLDFSKVFQLWLKTVSSTAKPSSQKSILENLGMFTATSEAYAELRVLEDEEAVANAFGGSYLSENDQSIRYALDKKKPIFYFAYGAVSQQHLHLILRSIINLLPQDATLVMPHMAEEIIIYGGVHDLAGMPKDVVRKIGGQNFGTLSGISIRDTRRSLEEHSLKVEMSHRPGFKEAFAGFLNQFGQPSR